MSTTSSVTTSSSLDAYGNTVTSAVSNDQLESSDFITLMLTQLKLQDPTSAVDSSTMLDTQLQLSNLEASTATVEAMEALQSTFEQSALSSSASLIGTIVENGDTDDEGNNKQYKISSVSMNDGEISLTAYELTGYYDVYYFDEVSSGSDVIDSTNEDSSMTLTNSDGNSYSFSTYNKTYDELAAEISETSGITSSVVQNSSGNYQLVVSISNGSSSLSQNNLALAYSEDTATAYGSEAKTISYNNITKIY
ncbi:MAG: flagellar hook capping FlgD N-terminal domain-containing protein [Arcobacter sp.]|uniref:flagellar hook capping FlgD N-terminal domain-containing protein n=1 Tax=Arcobacter sp. TaxID=1872629 RepID=UPI003D090F3A